MEKLQKWKDEYWQLEVDISEVKQNEMKRKLEDQLEEGARKEKKGRARSRNIKGCYQKID